MKRGRERLNQLFKRDGKLRITSMMDILTVLLLFLLKSFVAEGEVITPARGVELPESTSPDLPEASLVVAISKGSLLLGDEMIGKSAELEKEAGLSIAPLADGLRRNLEKSRAIARMRGEELDEEGLITVQGDREISFRLLQKVMFTCQQNGYGNISLAVIRN